MHQTVYSPKKLFLIHELHEIDSSLGTCLNDFIKLSDEMSKLQWELDGVATIIHSKIRNIRIIAEKFRIENFNVECVETIKATQFADLLEEIISERLI